MKEQEFLNSPVREDGVGEAEFVKALIYELPTASDVRAQEIGMELQKRMRGDASLLENPDQSEEISRLRSQAHEADKAAERYEKNKVGFVDSVIASAPKLTDKQRESLKVEGQHMLKTAIDNTKAGKTLKQLQFKQALRNAPLVDLHVTGKFVNTPQGARHLPEIVSIMGVKFNLKPGIQKVPQPVATAYMQAKQITLQKDKKQAILRGEGAQFGVYDQQEMAQKLHEVNQEFGSNYYLPGGQMSNTIPRRFAYSDTDLQSTAGKEIAPPGTGLKAREYSWENIARKVLIYYVRVLSEPPWRRQFPEVEDMLLAVHQKDRS